MIFIWLYAYIVNCYKYTDALNVCTNNDKCSPRLRKCIALDTVCRLYFNFYGLEKAMI